MSVKMRCINNRMLLSWASLVAKVVKNPPVSAGDTGDVGSIPGSESSPGGGTPVFLLG